MQIMLIALAALALYMCASFAVSLIRRDNGTADIAYGLGFALVGWVTYVLGGGSVVGFLATILATVWALRLSLRIFLRSRGKPEDFRYAAWRKEWGTAFVWRSFLQVYLLQGAVIYLVALPVLLLNVYGGEFGVGVLGLTGLALWIVGFFFETVGDAQLDAFIRNPKNKGHVMSQGLWRYTRHPNYFGESLMWWALGLIAFDTLLLTLALPWALIPFVGGALITFLLLKVSGVPLLEKRFAGNPEWEAYAARTSVFIPLPPKES